MGTLLLTLVLVAQGSATVPSAVVKADVDRLVRAAEQLTGRWPAQPAPAVPEVAFVARHGRDVTPLLMDLLSDDPNAERDQKQWKVQQQAALALARIYEEPVPCGRAYCDGDPPERIANVKRGWERKIAADAELRALSAADLVARFKQENMFFRQLEIARVFPAGPNPDVVRALEPWLSHDDRHLRGNVALLLARLGDPRGFSTIVEILADRSPRSEGQGIPGGRWSLSGQIRSDRYFAAHLLGDLKDPRGVDVLIPLLDDPDTESIVPWSLAEIGDRRAIPPLIEMLSRDAPATRVYTIYALERLNAREALPRLRELLNDHRKSNLGTPVTVSDAARRAIAAITP